MTRAKARRERQAIARFERAKRAGAIDTHKDVKHLPPDAVRADPAQLVHNNTYGTLPKYYVDRIIVCRQCGTEELWTAERQKWWYEAAKGNIYSQAILCRHCRRVARAKKGEARRVHLEGMARKKLASAAALTPKGRSKK